jgi:hypothetical protein
MKVGFFYNCFNQPQCVDFVLSNVREHFKESSIFLCSDGGEDFSKFANTYHCDYEFYEKNIGGSVSKPISYWPFMERLCRMLVYPIDYIVLLEDDVLCQKHIEYWPSQACAGPIGNEWNQSFKNLILKRCRNGFCSSYMFYGNCGGSIIHRDSFRRSILNMNKNLYEEAHLADSRFGLYPDASITGTLQLFGYGYERWLEHSEEDSGQPSLIGISAFRHQYKKLYAKV